MQASDSGYHFCAHLLLSEKCILLWRVHIFHAWFSPWHYVLHLSLGFSVENGYEDVPIREYFGFSHALHLLPTVFRNSFLLWRNYFFKDPAPLDIQTIPLGTKSRRKHDLFRSKLVFIEYISNFFHMKEAFLYYIRCFKLRFWILNLITLASSTELTFQVLVEKGRYKAFFVKRKKLAQLNWLV